MSEIRRTTATEAARRIPGDSINGLSEFDPESAHKGIVAEQRTAGILSTIMNGTDGKALHSVMIDGVRDIDHVFFCDRGVFVINTKYRASIHDVGRRLRNEWAAKVLADVYTVSRVAAFDHSGMFSSGPLFHAVIALWSKPTSVVVNDEHEGVRLVPGEQIADFIMSRPVVMSTDAASAMFETMRLKINKTLAGVTA